jgi:hypothetical protein
LRVGLVRAGAVWLVILVLALPGLVSGAEFCCGTRGAASLSCCAASMKMPGMATAARDAIVGMPGMTEASLSAADARCVAVPDTLPGELASKSEGDFERYSQGVSHGLLAVHFHSAAVDPMPLTVARLFGFYANAAPPHSRFDPVAVSLRI